MKTKIRRLSKSGPFKPIFKDVTSVTNTKDTISTSNTSTKSDLDINNSIFSRISHSTVPLMTVHKFEIDFKTSDPGYTSPTLSTDIPSRQEPQEVIDTIQEEVEVSYNASNTSSTNGTDIANKQELKEVANKIYMAQRIIIFVGAGINTNCRIPVNPTPYFRFRRNNK